MPAPYTLRRDGRDVFRTFVLPIPTDAAAVRARRSSFSPGNARAVHHANIGVDRTRSSRRLDDADPEPGYVGGMVPDAGISARLHARMDAGPAAAALARRHGRGDSNRTATSSCSCTCSRPASPKPVQVSVGFFFTDQPPARDAGRVAARQRDDRHSGRRRAYEITDRYVLPVDVDVLAIQPHAHNLGRDMEASATLPDGTVAAADRDRGLGFPLAGRLSLREPIVLPRGTTICDAVHLRQLRRQPAQSVPAAAADRLGTEHDRRDGRPLAAGGAAERGRSRHAERRHQRGRRAPRISPPTRR